MQNDWIGQFGGFKANNKRIICYYIRKLINAFCLHHRVRASSGTLLRGLNRKRSPAAWSSQSRHRALNRPVQAMAITNRDLLHQPGPCRRFRAVPENRLRDCLSEEAVSLTQTSPPHKLGGFLISKPEAEPYDASIQRPTVKRKDPELLTVGQAENMLKSTMGQDRAYAALGMFVGVRPEELPKLDWKHVDLESGIVRLPPEITKTNVGRILYLEPNAVAWLKTVKSRGLMFEGDASCLTGRLKTAAGLQEWPQNVLRHTFATMHVTAFEDAGRTALMMHSRENPKVLFQHYFRPTLKKNALKFWKIRPQALKPRSGGKKNSGRIGRGPETGLDGHGYKRPSQLILEQRS